MRKIAVGVLAFVYLLAMAYFVFRPFGCISGAGYAHADLEWPDGAVHVRRDASLEVYRDVSKIRNALMQSGRMSLEIVLQTDSLQQGGPALIVGFSRDDLIRNFSLSQEGNGLEFRLRTTETDDNGMLSSLHVPQVFDPDRKQHLVVTYDGATTRLFLDGKLRAESSALKGGFGNWGRDQALVIGDEPTGGYAWAGRIWRVALHGRALDAGEVSALCNGTPVPDALASHGFHANPATTGRMPDGLKRLSYRNLFITTDPAAYSLGDCLFNIAGFVPLGVFVYLLLPLRAERRKIFAVIAMPVLVGLAASGTIEFLQRYIATRVPCAVDLVYNVVGSLLGSLMAWLAFSTFENKWINRRNK